MLGMILLIALVLLLIVTLSLASDGRSLAAERGSWGGAILVVLLLLTASVRI